MNELSSVDLAAALTHTMDYTTEIKEEFAVSFMHGNEESNKGLYIYCAKHAPNSTCCKSKDHTNV